MCSNNGSGTGKEISMKFTLNKNISVLNISKYQNSFETKEKIISNVGVADSFEIDISDYDLVRRKLVNGFNKNFGTNIIRLIENMKLLEEY